MVRLRKAWLPQCNFVGLGHWNWLRSAGYPGPLLKWNICTFQYVSLLQCRLNLNTLKRANCQMLLHIIWWCFSRHDSLSQNIKEKQASLIIFLWLLTKHCLNMVTHTLAWQESISHWMKWKGRGGEENKETGKGKDLIKVDSFTVLSPLPRELTRSPPPPPPPLPWQSSCCCCWQGCCRCRPSAPTPSPPSCASSFCSGTRLSPASLHSILFEERGSG